MTRPLQVYLDGEDLGRLDAWARERGWTTSQVVRMAIRLLTRRPDEDPLLELSGDIDGLPADLSARLDRYLNETFASTRTSRPPGSRGGVPGLSGRRRATS